MTELLAIPAWNTAPKTLDDWRAALEAQGHPARVAREDGNTWLEVGPLRLRGYVELAGPHVEAINFELDAPDPEQATRALIDAAGTLGWEVHADEPDEDDIDED